VQRHTWKLHKLIPISVDLPITQRQAWLWVMLATGPDSKKFLRRFFQKAASFWGEQIKPGPGKPRHVQRHTWKIHKLIPISVDLPITQPPARLWVVLPPA
jgi:hypothetical protein